jgi:hypothetical protein
MQSAHCTEQRIEAESANKRSPPPITGTALYEPLNKWLLHFVPLVWSFLLDLFSLTPVQLYLLIVSYHLCFSFASFSNILL